MSSAFRRLVTALPGASSRRAYSVFSSKSGGGRYFNSAKSKTPAVVASKPKSDTASKDASTTTSSPSTTAADGTSNSDPSTSRAVADYPRHRRFHIPLSSSVAGRPAARRLRRRPCSIYYRPPFPILLRL
ncbi:hypothetical protein NMY22_g2327 [Coprinellus aureogranulatus]|nr:hypothetical protein NMY22_g2327 [Coprinellus aureogranulatus]